MSTFDPMAVAIDWLDAYRATSVSDIIQLYDDSAAIECSCGGSKTILGRDALAAYWRKRFVDKPASELTDLQMDNGSVIVAYEVPEGVVQAKLEIGVNGKITRTVCAPCVKSSC